VPTILPHVRPLYSAEHNHRIVLCRFSAGFAESAGGPPERPQSLHQKPWPLGAGVSGAIHTLVGSECSKATILGESIVESPNAAVQRLVYSRLPSLDEGPFETRGRVVRDIAL
jgi:hypothetical protein